MIEIKITLDDAIKLLLERMNFELLSRQKNKVIIRGSRLENLPYDELISIVETAVFDTIILLPPDLLLTDTNLGLIITKTIQSLARVIGREELSLYSYRRTQKLLSLARRKLKNASKDNSFQNN